MKLLQFHHVAQWPLGFTLVVAAAGVVIAVLTIMLAYARRNQ